MQLGVVVLVSGVLVLHGCASRPAEPPEPLKPIKLLAVLPVSMPISDFNTGFGATGRQGMPIVLVPAEAASYGGVSAGETAALSVLAYAIASGIQSSNQRRRDELAQALSLVNFDAAAQIESKLLPALERRQVPLVRITDPQVAAEVRARRFQGLPAGVDAILDIRIPESGYYYSFRADAYSPMLLVTASIFAPDARSDSLEEFSYYADLRDGAGDRRWITTPQSMTFSEIDGLKASAVWVRAGLRAVVDQMVALMAEDVHRRMVAKPRVE